MFFGATLLNGGTNNGCYLWRWYYYRWCNVYFSQQFNLLTIKGWRVGWVWVRHEKRTPNSL